VNDVIEINCNHPVLQKVASSSLLVVCLFKKEFCHAGLGNVYCGAMNKRNVCLSRNTGPKDLARQYIGYPGQSPSYAIKKH
jgi:hypothetical protein